MSDKLAMVAVDKVRVALTIPVKVKIKLEKMRDAAGLPSINEMCNVILDGASSHIELTEVDVDKISEIIKNNIRTRERQKRERGLA